MITPDQNGVYHPKNEDEIVGLIQSANKSKLQVRVRGAAQSVAGAIFADDGPNINMELDQLSAVTFDDAAMQVTVGAGCNLGFNPYDPAQVSTIKGSLFYKLNQKGWAIPNVSDAIHQTVAGFMATGSAAGSMMHSFDEHIESFNIIDGLGNKFTYSKTDTPNNNFYAAGVSMGLLGIITSVTLQCIPAFNIIGSETTSKLSDGNLDFLGNSNNGKPTLVEFLSNAEFARILWWPYRTVQRIITWEAKTMVATDYNQQTGSATNFNPKPYQPIFPKVANTALPSEILAAEGYNLIGTWPSWLEDLMGISEEEAKTREIIQIIFPYAYPLLLDMFFPCNSDKKPPQQFWDNWLNSLNMDREEFSTNLFNLCYTEIWVDIADAEKVVNYFQDYYQAESYAATWVYCVEVLAGKSSEFWMSPGYGRNSARINIMWWLSNKQKPMDYFQQFWDLLKDKNVPFCLHWGKYLAPPSSKEGASYIINQYPKWEEFKQLREKMDPNNIFLTTYWKNQLGL